MNVQRPQGLRVKNLNCRKQPEVLKSLLNTTDPTQWDVLCLQEPPHNVDRMTSYRSPRWNLIPPSPAAARKPEEVVRSVIYVSNHLPSDSYSQVNVKTLDLTALRFSFPDQNFTLLSVYNPPNSDITIPFIRTALRDPLAASVPCMLMGDFNLHHPLWAGHTAPQRTNRSDTDTFLALLADYDFTLALAIGTPTHYSDAHDSWSTIDLVFTSDSIADLVMECDTDDGHGSDHCAVNTVLNLEVPITPAAPRPQWRKTDWDEFTRMVADGWMDRDIEQRAARATSTGDVDCLVHDITDVFQEAAKKTVPTSTPSNFSKLWWTPELTRLHQEFKRVKNRAEKNSATEAEREAALIARRKYHSEIRVQQRRHWRTWLNEATEQTVFRASKYVTQAPEDALAARLPALNLPDGTVARTGLEKRDALMAQFFPVPPSADLSDIADTVYPDQLAHDPVTGHEVSSAIADLSPYKAPGPSGIPNAALQQCADTISAAYTSLANACIRLGYHPTAWKTFTTITLRKPGKPSYLIPKAYRPIALEDTSGKVMEAVVARRLAALAEQHGLLPTTHFGGRAGRTTTDALLYLGQRIKDAWRKGHVATVLFLDITSAFPSVNHARLLHNLRKRGVPEELVRWIENFLTDRCTQLKFDDYTSPPLRASTGLPQGSPLSPILYLFYSADLLEIVDAADRDRASGGFIDDTTFVVTSPTVAQNVAMLEELDPQLLGWSDHHACKFDVPKFQMLHCTRNEKKYEALPLVIGTHTIVPSDSAKYLGVVVDRKLRWREHADLAVAKGTSAMLAVARLSKPTFGLPHKHIRQLVRSVVIPKMEYALPVWYTPVHTPAGSKRRTGSVGLVNRLGKVQRLAARVISGAFKTTATAALDYHAGLPPIDLRLNQTAFNATVRLASLPPSHPLHKIVKRCARTCPRFHHSPIHELFKAFPQVRDVETVDPGLVNPTWESPFEVVIEPDKMKAVQLVEELVRGDEFCVFTDGSGFQGLIGASAVAHGKLCKHVRRVHLGDDTEHTVFEGKVTGMILALDVIAAEPRATHATILLDNRAALKAVTHRRARAGQQLVELFHRQYDRLKRKRRTLTIKLVWVPGHCDVAGNEWADLEAKEAATTGESTPLPPALQPLLDLPKSQSALKAAYKKQLSRDWSARWASCPQGKRMAKDFDSSPPGGNRILRWYKDLPRRQASIITQLRTGHVGLNRFLCRIKAVSLPQCQECGVEETVLHYLLTCRRYDKQRAVLKAAIRKPLSRRVLLGDPKHRQELLTYVEATGRFASYLEGAYLLIS